jgi:hypothetical protein
MSSDIKAFDKFCKCIQRCSYGVKKLKGGGEGGPWVLIFWYHSK